LKAIISLLVPFREWLRHGRVESTTVVTCTVVTCPLGTGNLAPNSLPQVRDREKVNDVRHTGADTRTRHVGTRHVREEFLVRGDGRLSWARFVARACARRP
jgi:hypothetical protein